MANWLDRFRSTPAPEPLPSPTALLTPAPPTAPAPTGPSAALLSVVERVNDRALAAIERGDDNMARWWMWTLFHTKLPEATS